MKKIYFLFMLVAISYGMNAQTIFSSSFENWNDSLPNDWYGTKSSIEVDSVIEVTSGTMFGSKAVALKNTESSHRRLTTQWVEVVESAVIDVELWVKGTGEIRTGIYYDTTGGYAYQSYNVIDTNEWHMITSSIAVANTDDSAQFILSVRNTAGPSQLMVDSIIFKIEGSSVQEVLIYDIQFTTDISGDSPYMDQLVTTSGVVTALTSGGYVIQDSIAAWNGIYVFDNTNTPEIGDEVQVTGMVTEYFGYTEIINVSDYNELSTGNVPYGTVEVSTGAFDQEAYESVLVKVNNSLCVDTNQSTNFGIWMVDDGSGTANIDDWMYHHTPELGALYEVGGIVNYAFSTYSINPRDSNDVVEIVDSLVSIYDIQYTTNIDGSSDYAGQSVQTVGIVTAVMPTNGYFLQQGAGAWNGIYVYDFDHTPAIGDLLTISGTVEEYFDLTEIKDITDYQLQASGIPVPEATELTTNEVNQEMYEGVLVKTVGTCVDTNISTNFGIWKIDDGSGIANIDDIIYSYVPQLNEDYQVTGPVHYAFDEYRILPRDADDVELIMTTSNEGKFTKDQIKMYPNPSNNYIIIDGNNSYNLNVFNVAGELVFKSFIERKSTIIDMSKWQSGAYSFQFISGKNTQTKLVFKR